jgi:hypothetical protein
VFRLRKKVNLLTSMLEDQTRTNPDSCSDPTK